MGALRFCPVFSQQQSLVDNIVDVLQSYAFRVYPSRASLEDALPCL
jgi:hypothetical protein